MVLFLTFFDILLYIMNSFVLKKRAHDVVVHILFLVLLYFVIVVKLRSAYYYEDHRGYKIIWTFFNLYSIFLWTFTVKFASICGELRIMRIRNMLILFVHRG